MSEVTELLAKRYQTLVGDRIRDVAKIKEASRQIDAYRESLRTKVKDWESAEVIREWRDKRCMS